MSNNVEISPNRTESGRLSSEKPRSRRRRIFIRLAFALLFLLILLFIAACVVWINRNLVMEEFVRRQIEQRGFEAQLTVDEITDSEARLRHVLLSQNGEFIASADKIEISYLWPNIKSGEIISVNLDGAKAAISLDEAGKVNNTWMPKSETGAAMQFPSGGVSVKDSQVQLSLPYGDVSMKGDVTARASDEIDVDISFGSQSNMQSNTASEAGQLHYKDTRLNLADKGGYFKGGLSGKQIIIEQSWAEFDAVTIGEADITATPSQPISLTAKGVLSLPELEQMRNYTFDGALRLAGLNIDHPNIDARAAHSAFDGSVHYNGNRDNGNGGAFDLRGLLTGGADSAAYLKERSAPYAKGQDLSVSYEGQIAKTDKAAILLSGLIDLEAQDLGFANRADARNLAERLAVHEGLSATPVAQNFHADITAQIAHIFEGAQTRAHLSLEHDEAGYRLGLSEPLELMGQLTGRDKQNGLTISASESASGPASGGAPFITFAAAQDELKLSADLALSGARALDVSALKLSAASKTGLSLLGVQSVSGVISSLSEWRGQGTRLSPFIVDLTYTAKNEVVKNEAGRNEVSALTHLAVETHLDYDGPFLNSELTGLKASGRLSREGRGSNSMIWFDAGAPVQIGNVVTQTGWGAQNVKAVLESGAPLLTQGSLSSAGSSDNSSGSSSAGQLGRLMEMPLQQLSAIVYDDTGEKNFTVKADKAKVSGSQTAAGQTWEAVFNGFDVFSDTTPSPNSQLSSDDVTLSLERLERPVGDGGDLGGAADLPWTYKLKTQALNADLAQLKLEGVGVELSGQGSDFTANYQGGTAELDGTNLPPLPMTGQASYQGGVLSGTAKTAMPRAAQFPIYANYFYENGIGTADLNIPEFIFSPATIQPAELAPALRGKIAQVSGLASAKVTLGYKLGEGVSSSGTVTLTDMDIGTLVGPFTGVNTTLNLDNLVPLRSLGTQTITMSGFNPGLPLGEGFVSFDVVEGGIALHEARWPLNTGHIYIEPTTWDTEGRVNRIIVRVEDVSLAALIGELGNEDISATGQISGVLPILIDGVSVLVEDGNLSVQEGGVIRVRTEGLDAAGASNETAKIAIDALKEFQYKELSLDINGPLDGDMVIGAVFSGKNTDVLGGADFLFRVNIEGELLNIAKSFAKNAKVEEFLRVLDEELR